LIGASYRRCESRWVIPDRRFEFFANDARERPQQVIDSVFIKLEFFLWVLFSIVLPVGIYSYMLWKNAISRMSVLGFGASLIVISGVTVLLLQRLNELAKLSPALFDDRLFSSELSVALYLLPAVFAGIGVNTISHVLVSHLIGAEKAFDQAAKNVLTTVAIPKDLQ
jgi:hypothetical protein